jgi:hypothetical protein
LSRVSHEGIGGFAAAGEASDRAIVGAENGLLFAAFVVCGPIELSDGLAAGF